MQIKIRSFKYHIMYVDISSKMYNVYLMNESSMYLQTILIVDLKINSKELMEKSITDFTFS